MRDDRYLPLWMRVAVVAERIGPARARAMLARLLTARDDVEAKRILAETCDEWRDARRCPGCGVLFSSPASMRIHLDRECAREAAR